MQGTALSVVSELPARTYPPCPPWCVEHHDADADHPTDWIRHHDSGQIRLHCAGPEHYVSGQQVVLELSRSDCGGKVGNVLVLIGAVRDNEPDRRTGALTPDDQVLAADARRIGEALIAIADTALRVHPKAICLDCGEEFDLDSSPHLDRCWRHAEEFDLEAEANQ